MPAACSSWAPMSAVAPARIQARKRRQSPKLWMSLSEPMAQKLVANTTAPNRKPTARPPSAKYQRAVVGDCVAKRVHVISSERPAHPAVPACIDDYAQACQQPGEPTAAAPLPTHLRDRAFGCAFQPMDTTIRSGSGSHAPGRQLAPTFVHLKVHSAYSLLEGAITFPRLAKLAAAQGFPAVGLTDTNNLFGALEFSDKLADAGVQPIVGLHAAAGFRRSGADQFAAAQWRAGAARAAGRRHGALRLQRGRLAEPHEACLVRLLRSRRGPAPAYRGRHGSTPMAAA